MAINDKKVLGLTKSAGFEIGVRKSFPISHQKAWELVTSPEVINLWLGKTPHLNLVKGERYQTDEGISGQIKVINPGVNIRLTWQPKGWSKASTVQVRTIPNGNKTTISFHQENLPGENEREARQRYWQKVLAGIQILVEREINTEATRLIP
ncbi:MAG: SRPBCC domain-containing protein [Chloroflexi bacterium]|uniref:SRPBCC domain-containing protein n=1 Tax=Candidatus Chlorohelix allophototropha TaxID=3003348 RepID=A0A8T7LUJ4_9CHLR|nr:SRPBCC domain-containing protein [Chloroflexota bacterium]WJW66444.1 SRPBCC domain-containing protein [Chloroflexota bacterium L227-S17]